MCAARKCVAPVAMGAPCSAMAPCRANLYCSATSNTCATPLPLGAACGGDTSGCDFRQGVSCNTFAVMANQKCETVAAAKGGQACGLVNSTLTLCIANNTCQGISLIPLQTDGRLPEPGRRRHAMQRHRALPGARELRRRPVPPAQHGLVSLNNG